MIQLEGVTSIFPGTLRRPMLSNVTLTIPTDRKVAIFGSHPPSMTALVRLLAERVPDAGRIVRHARVSMPIPSCVRTLRGDYTARKNAWYAARDHGADADEVVNFLEKFSDLGPAFDDPLADITLAQQVFVGMAIAYSIPFDVYVIDGAVARGEQSLRRKLVLLFEARTKNTGVILATNDIKLAKKYCDMGAVLHEGKLLLLDDLTKAISIFQDIELQAEQRGPGRQDERGFEH